MTIIHCTACRQILIKDLEIEADSPTGVSIVANLKCPHCKVPNRIEIRTKISFTNEIRVNGRLLAPGTGAGDPRGGIRTLSDG